MILNEDYFDTLDIKEEDIQADDNIEENTDFKTSADFLRYCMNNYTHLIVVNVCEAVGRPTADTIDFYKRKFYYILENYEMEHSEMFVTDDDTIVDYNLNKTTMYDYGYKFITDLETEPPESEWHWGGLIDTYQLVMYINLPKYMSSKPQKFVKFQKLFGSQASKLYNNGHRLNIDYVYIPDKKGYGDDLIVFDYKTDEKHDDELISEINYFLVCQNVDE